MVVFVRRQRSYWIVQLLTLGRWIVSSSWPTRGEARAAAVDLVRSKKRAVLSQGSRDAKSLRQGAFGGENLSILGSAPDSDCPQT